MFSVYIKESYNKEVYIVSPLDAHNHGGHRLSELGYQLWPQMVLFPHIEAHSAEID